MSLRLALAILHSGSPRRKSNSDKPTQHTVQPKLGRGAWVSPQLFPAELYYLRSECPRCTRPGGTVPPPDSLSPHNRLGWGQNYQVAKVTSSECWFYPCVSHPQGNDPFICMTSYLLGSSSRLGQRLSLLRMNQDIVITAHLLYKIKLRETEWVWNMMLK